MAGKWEERFELCLAQHMGGCRGGRHSGVGEANCGRRVRGKTEEEE